MELWKRYRPAKKTVETMMEEVACSCGGAACGSCVSCGENPQRHFSISAQVTADYAWYVTAANAG